MYIKENAKRRRMYQTLWTNSEGIVVLVFTKSVIFENEGCHFKELSIVFVSIDNVLGDVSSAFSRIC